MVRAGIIVVRECGGVYSAVLVWARSRTKGARSRCRLAEPGETEGRPVSGVVRAACHQCDRGVASLTDGEAKNI